MNNTTLLLIRDGWGKNHNNEQDACNAVKIAQTPCSDNLSNNWPRTEILACGLDVGLPEGIMGNSEVGHQNIGAGRIVDQEIVRIDKAFNSNTVENNIVFKKAISNVIDNNKSLHLLGLVSDGGVHSSIEHLYDFLRILKNTNISNVYIHAITDGRDTPPQSGINFIKDIQNNINSIGIGQIATIMGRFWAMDRDNRWERIEKAYDCMTAKSSIKSPNPVEVLEEFYKKSEGTSQKGDEFLTPTVITYKNGQPIGSVQHGDSVIFFNFRGDRPRQITHAFIDKEFTHFNRESFLDPFFVTMTEYQQGLCENVIFPKPPKMQNILGEYLSKLGKKQFRCAETEKYPHVTFFFNDYREEPFIGEDRAMIQSPKDVLTYDLKPEMSAQLVTEKAVEAILSKKYDFIVINFANPDMVGHTGNLEAAVKACSFVDTCIQKILEALDEVKGNAIITADHGNADQMWDFETNTPHTRHTLNPVEVILYGSNCKSLNLRKEGRLADIAPTLLDIMDIEQPVAMTGQTLINH